MKDLEQKGKFLRSYPLLSEISICNTAILRCIFQCDRSMNGQFLKAVILNIFLVKAF